MKKIKALSFAFGVALLLLVVGPLCPARAGTGTYMDISQQVLVSTNPASPTTLIAATQSAYADIRIICNQYSNAGENVLIQSSSAGFSTSITTGTARIPCLPSTVQQIDYMITDYRGAIYAITTSTYQIPISVWRKR